MCVYLVGIHHKDIPPVVTDRLARDTQPSLIILEVTPDFDLKVTVPLRESLTQQRLHLILAITQPSRTGSISRHGLTALRLTDTVLLTRLDLLEESDGLLRRQGVSDIAEVDAADELLGGHVSDDTPDGLAEGLGPQVPEGVDDGAESQVDDALFGTDPAQLAV